MTIAEIMEELKAKKRELVAIQNSITPDYLATASEDELKGKIVRIGEIVEQFSTIWHGVPVTDQPDASVGFDAIMTEVFNIRTELTNQLKGQVETKGRDSALQKITEAFEGLKRNRDWETQ